MQHAPQFLKIVNDAKSRVPEVTVDQVRQMQSAGEKFEFIDCREDNEWTAGRANRIPASWQGHHRAGYRESRARSRCQGGDLLWRRFPFRASRRRVEKKWATPMCFRWAGGIKAWRDAGLPEEKG